jgi:hypothetical protein
MNSLLDSLRAYGPAKMSAAEPARSVAELPATCSDEKPRTGAATATNAYRCLLIGRKNMEYLPAVFLLNPHEPIIKFAKNKYEMNTFRI